MKKNSEQISTPPKYTADDFIGGAFVGSTDTKQDLVDKKVSLLHDFCLLKKNDDREQSVRAVLDKCNTENEMSIVLHDVLVGNTTLDAMLTRKGVM